MAGSWTWVEREVEAACERPLPLVELGAAVSSSLGRVVPHDGYCLFGFDPVTGLISLHTSRGGYRDVLRDCNRLWENEQLENDLNRLGDLARAPLPVGLLGTDSPAERASPRRHEIMPAAGFGAEMRVALVAGQTLWGALVLVRERRRSPFGSADAAWVARLGPTLARAVRRLPVVEPLPQDVAGIPPGVILLGPGNAVEAVSAEARRWLARIDGVARGDEVACSDGLAMLPLAVCEVANAARRTARDPAAPDPTCRVRAATGEWVVLHASLLDRDPGGRATVVLQAGGPGALLPALAAWYGISEREHAVLDLVLEGRPTKQIARRLRLSPHTVNDHLKAIFRKVGVSGRQELLAALRG